jgi:nuclear transport factor 2 (NTF2) superfamily protein
MDMPKESVQGEEIMATATTPARPPLPPFTRESAIQKVRLAEDGWNTRDPAKVALAYEIDSRWRNQSEFVNGRNEIIAFLTRKWAKELDYRLIKELWSVRFAYEWHDDSGHWYRSYGNENWEFNDDGSWPSGLRQSTTFLFWNQIANITGRSGGVPMTTED